MLRYYTVPLIGTGTDEDPIRPDVPAGTSWVGNAISSRRYLIATPVDLPPQADRTKREKRTQLEETAKGAGWRHEDVESWQVGGS